MERLTEERGERTWKLYHIGWYLNLVLVILALLASVYYLGEVQAGNPADRAENTTMMAATLIIACVFLMGAGVGRYIARQEGQHLELKLAMNKILSEVEQLKRQVGPL